LHQLFWGGRAQGFVVSPKKVDVFAEILRRAVGVNELLMHQAAKYGVKLNRKSFAWHLGPNELSCDGVF
jgi:hypothetical protein